MQIGLTTVSMRSLAVSFPELTRFGLIEIPGMKLDLVEQYWMPRHFILTERFWLRCGVSMDKLLLYLNLRIEAEEEGIAG